MEAHAPLVRLLVLPREIDAKNQSRRGLFYVDGRDREIILQSCLDVSLAPRAFQIFLAFGGIAFVQATFPVHKLKWSSLLR